MPDLFETLALTQLAAIAGERAARQPRATTEDDDAQPWGRGRQSLVIERRDHAVRRPRRAGSTLGA